MELVAQIPSGLKLRHNQSKYVFKKALEGVVPADVLTRSKKGFAVPVAEWFRNELKPFAHEVLIERQDDVLNPSFLASCWKQHQRGQRDWSALLWCVLMFRTWQEVSKAA
jgi:asparagine synthase (glutamine-hydrolysing)